MQDESKKNVKDQEKKEIENKNPEKVNSSGKGGTKSEKNEASMSKKKEADTSPKNKEKKHKGKKGTPAGKQQSDQKKDQLSGKAKKEETITEQVIKINRVAKVVKGGKNFSFSAMVVAGDGNGRYGIGFGKSNEVVGCIKKGAARARKKLKPVKLKGDTIPHEVIGRYKSSRVILKPAGRGTGVIAGGPVRAICDAVGIKNILTKSLGSRNEINVVKAAADGFEQLRLERRGR